MNLIYLSITEIYDIAFIKELLVCYETLIFYF